MTAARDGRFASHVPLVRLRRRELRSAPPGRGRRPRLPAAALVLDGDPRLGPAGDLIGGASGRSCSKIDPFNRARRRSVWLHYALAGTAGGVLAIIAFLLLVVFGPKPEPPIAGLPPAGGSTTTKYRCRRRPIPQRQSLSRSSTPRTLPAADPQQRSRSEHSASAGGSAANQHLPSRHRRRCPCPPAPSKDPFEDIVKNKKLQLMLPQRPGRGRPDRRRQSAAVAALGRRVCAVSGGDGFAVARRRGRVRGRSGPSESRTGETSGPGQHVEGGQASRRLLSARRKRSAASSWRPRS